MPFAGVHIPPLGRGSRGRFEKGLFQPGDSAAGVPSWKTGRQTGCADSAAGGNPGYDPTPDRDRYRPRPRPGRRPGDPAGAGVAVDEGPLDAVDRHRFGVGGKARHAEARLFGLLDGALDQGAVYQPRRRLAHRPARWTTHCAQRGPWSRSRRNRTARRSGFGTIQDLWYYSGESAASLGYSVSSLGNCIFERTWGQNHLRNDRLARRSRSRLR